MMGAGSARVNRSRRVAAATRRQLPRASPGTRERMSDGIPAVLRRVGRRGFHASLPGVARPILYPLLFALAPVFDLYSVNRDVVDPGDLVLPVSIGLVALALFQLGLARWLRDARRAALASGLLVFVFAYAPRIAPTSWIGTLGTAYYVLSV